MQRIDRIHAKPVHDPLFDHDAATAAVFLGRLKHQHGAPREITRLGKVSRRPQQHRRVPVMAAGMHRARPLGRPFRACRLVDRQCIHIGTQRRHRAVPLALDHRDDTGLGDTFMDLVHPEFAQALGHEPRGFVQVVR